MSHDLYNNAPWMDAKIDQLLARMEEAATPEGVQLISETAPVLVLFLTEPETDTPEGLAHWELACDKCNQIRPLHSGLTTRQWRGMQVMISFGFCTECRDLLNKVES